MKTKFSGHLLAMLLFTVQVTHAAELQGKVEWTSPLNISTNLAAEVMASPVAVGERVEKGQLLLQLEDSVANAQLAQANAAVAHYKLLREESKSELQRSEELYDRTLLADHDLVLARIAHAEADSRYRQALTSLKEAQRALALRQITAPFDALIVARFARKGETVNGQYQSVPLLSLVEWDKRRVVLEVESKAAQRIKVGEVLHLAAGGKSYTAPVASIMPQEGSALEGKWNIEINFTADSKGMPQAGEMATVTVP